MKLDFPKYYYASELKSSDREWVISLQCDRGTDCVSLGVEQIQKLVNLVRFHRLPCVMTSGPFGNLSISILDHSPFPEIRPEILLRVSESHFELPRGFDKWDVRFDYMSQFSHTSENREISAFYNLPLPKDKHQYEY